MLIDEWQEVPTVLGAVKRSIDADAGAGRFLLTGSVNARLNSQTWPGTGRVVPIHATPMAERELEGNQHRPSFIDQIARDGSGILKTPPTELDLRDYLDRALRGGFPEPALRYRRRAGARWYEGYWDQIYSRDVVPDSRDRNPDRVRRFVHAFILNSASTVELTKLTQAAELARNTAQEYEQLLKNLFLVEAVPAWTQHRLKRLTKAPKRVMSDSGLLAAALRLDMDSIIRDGRLVGQILETFVIAQWRAELEASGLSPRLYHLRQQQGRHEIDLIVELPGDRVIAVEIKADAAPNHKAAVHLDWLAQEIGDRFAAGIVLHTVPHSFALSDMIHAVPISALWQLDRRPPDP